MGGKVFGGIEKRNYKCNGHYKRELLIQFCSTISHMVQVGSVTGELVRVGDVIVLDDALPGLRVADHSWGGVDVVTPHRGSIVGVLSWRKGTTKLALHAR